MNQMMIYVAYIMDSAFEGFQLRQESSRRAERKEDRNEPVVWEGRGDFLRQSFHEYVRHYDPRVSLLKFASRCFSSQPAARMYLPYYYMCPRARCA